MEDLTTTATVAHGPTTENTLFTPEVGKIYRIVHIAAYVPDPAGSSSGTHQLLTYLTNTTSDEHLIFYVLANTGVHIYYGRYHDGGGTTILPAGICEFQDLMHGNVWISSNYPLKFAYTNSTDVDQTGTRRLKVYYLEYEER